MKNLTLLMLLFVSAVTYSQRLKTFVHPTDGFEIGIPKGWNVNLEEGISLYVSDSKYRKDGTIFIHTQPVVKEPFDIVYNDYINAIKNNGRKIIEIGDEVINGRKYKVYYKSYSSIHDYKVIEYFTIKDGKIFTASFTALKENFDKLEPLFKKVASTIKY